MDLKLGGSKALVTGASSGIGRATALALAAEGVELVVTARRQGELEETVRAALAAGAPRAIAVSADLYDPEVPAMLVERTLAELGGVGIVVANGPPTMWGGLMAWDGLPYERGLQGKALAYVRLARAAIPSMQRAGGGVLIAVAGLAGRSAAPAYLLGTMDSKAVHGMTRSLADEFGADGIRFLCVDPGIIDTPRVRETVLPKFTADGSRTEEDVYAEMVAAVPLGRAGRPEDVADVIAFLASPRAAYVTGTSIPVDGGRSRVVD